MSSHPDLTPEARVELEHELEWQVEHCQSVERQLDAALRRAYEAEQMCARLWGALGLLSASRGTDSGEVVIDPAAAPWPAVAGQMARVLHELTLSGSLPMPQPARAAVSEPDAVLAPLRGLNMTLGELVDAPPPSPAETGARMLAGAVSLAPTAKQAHHAVHSAKFDLGQVEGRSSNRLLLLCRARDVGFLRFTVKADRVSSPAHLLLETAGWTTVQVAEGKNIRLGLLGAEPREGWTLLVIALQAEDVLSVGLQIALSDLPNSYTTHFAGRDGQRLDLGWLMIAPAEDQAGGTADAAAQALPPP